MVFVLVLVTLGVVWYLWTRWRQSYWSRLGVPHPEPNLFTGNIGAVLTFSEHIGSLIERWYNEFKNVPYFGYYKFSTPAVVTCDPELIKNVLTKDFEHFAVNDMHISEKYDELFAPNAFLTQNVNTWKRSRHNLVPVFSVSKVKAIYPMMEQSCETLKEYLISQSGEKYHEAKTLCVKFTAENTVKCAFSLKAGCFDSDQTEYLDLGRKILMPSKMSAIKTLMMPLLPKWMSNHIPISFIAPDVDKWFRQLITENRMSRVKIQNTSEDLLQALISTAERLGSTDSEIASHALTLYFNGFETSSTVLLFLLYELARNTHVQEHLHEEIMEVNSRHDNKFTYSALQDMEYLECVINESHRLNPLIALFIRVCTKEYTFPAFGTMKEGVKIYPGTTVVIPVRAIHHDPQYYPDPEIFDPTRFTKDKIKERSKVLHMPFGFGPKTCLGMHFGHIQVKVAAMTIVRDFIIRLRPDQSPFEQSPNALTLCAKNEIYLSFEPRKK